MRARWPKFPSSLPVVYDGPPGMRDWLVVTDVAPGRLECLLTVIRRKDTEHWYYYFVPFTVDYSRDLEYLSGANAAGREALSIARRRA